MSYKRKYNFLKIISLIIVILYNSYYFFTRSYIANIKDNLMEEMHLNASQFSKISAAFSLGYSVLQIFSGYLLEKISFRYLSFIFMLIASAANYIFITYNNPLIAEYSRYILGFCFSIGSIGPLKYLSVVWSEKFGILANSLSFLNRIAAAYAASSFVKGLFNSYGWRNSLKLYIIFGLFIAIMLFFLLKIMTNKENNKSEASEEISIKVNFKESILQIIKLPGISANMVYATTIAAASYILMDGAGNTLLHAKFPHLDNSWTSWPATCNMIGAAFGNAYNVVHNYLNTKLKTQMLLHSIIGLFAVVMMVFFTANLYVFLGCCFFIGFASSGANASFIWLKRNLSSSYHGIGFGLLNFISMFFGSAIVQRLSGVILDLVKTHNIRSGASFYEGYNYSDILFMFRILVMGTTLIALFSAIFLKKDTK